VLHLLYRATGGTPGARDTGTHQAYFQGRTQQLTAGPLKLVQARARQMHAGYGWLRILTIFGELYGEQLCYRSGLNASMVAHVNGKDAKILERLQLLETH
jgi:hypothetical protein